MNKEKPKINLDGIHEGIKLQIQDHLKELSVKFPTTYSMIESISVKKLSESTYATTTDMRLELNSVYFSDPVLFTRELEKRQKENRFIKGSYSILSVISHEFAHLLHNSYLRMTNIHLIPIKIERKKGLFSKNPDIGTISDIIGRWFNHGNFIAVNPIYANLHKNSIKRKRETFAEAFTSIIHNSENEWDKGTFLSIN